MWWVGLSTQTIWVDVVGCGVLTSVSETRDQRKMGELRAEESGRCPRGERDLPENMRGSCMLELAVTAETLDLSSDKGFEPQIWLTAGGSGLQACEFPLLQREPSNSSFIL